MFVVFTTNESIILQMLVFTSEGLTNTTHCPRQNKLIEKAESAQQLTVSNQK